jgi:beta-1,4-mannosyltransferase
MTTHFLIISPILNGSEYIIDNCEQMLRIKQSAKDTAVTWLIRDGGSSDNTLSLLRQWISHHGCQALRESLKLDIHVASAKDEGMYDALNKGLDHARLNAISYDIFFWLNADDRLAEYSLQSMAELYSSLTQESWFIARGIDINERGLVVNDKPHDYVDIDQLRSGEFNYTSAQWIKAESCFFTHRIVRQLKGFDGTLKLAGDYEFILRAANFSPPAYGENCTSREFRRWPGQQSASLSDYEIERRKVYTQHRLKHRKTLFIKEQRTGISNKLFFYPDYTNGNGYQDELYNGVNAYGYPTIEHLMNANLLPGKGEIFHLHWLNDIISRSLSDATHLWDWLQDFILRTKANGALFIWTVHNIHSHENTNLELEREIVTFLVHECDRCHMHDQLVLYAFEKHYGILPWGRIRIAEHGAYPKNQSARLPCILSELGLLSTDPYVVIPGQIRHYKNLLVIEEGLRYLHRNYPELTVCLLGQFHPEVTLEDAQRIRNFPNIRWLSFRLNDDQYSALVREALFAFITYKTISTSGAVIHCLSQSCRVVAPKIGAIPSVIQGEEQGFLYTNNDRESLFSAMGNAIRVSRRFGKSDLTSSTVSSMHWQSILPKILAP